MRTGRAGDCVRAGRAQWSLVARCAWWSPAARCARGSLVALRARWPLATARLGVVLGLSGAILSGAASAQDRSVATEVPIGTFTLGTPHDGFSVVEPPAGVPERKRDSGDDGSGRWFFQGWESTPSRDSSAESLYTSAMTALGAGRRDEAQRLLERLISEAPDSPRAEAARQHLGQIYRGTSTSAEVDARAGGAGSDAPLPWASEADDGSASDLPWRPTRAALHQARVPGALDGEFLESAGDRVFFGAGSSELGARARGVIQSQARFLARYSELYVVVEGFADDGALADAETQRLSEQRAAVVRERLILEGVNEGRILAYGRAREDRVSDCPEPECLAQNRRAVTIIVTRRLEAGGRPPRRAQGGPSPSGPSPTQ